MIHLKDIISVARVSLLLWKKIPHVFLLLWLGDKFKYSFIKISRSAIASLAPQNPDISLEYFLSFKTKPAPSLSKGIGLLSVYEEN